MRKFFGFLWLGFIIFLAIFGLTISLLLGNTLATVAAGLVAQLSAFAAGPYFDLQHIIAYVGALLLLFILIVWYVRLFKRMKPFMRFLIPIAFLITGALVAAGYLRRASLLAAYADPATKQLAMYTIGSLGLAVFFGLLLSLTGFFDTFRADYFPRRKAAKPSKTKAVAAPVAAEVHDEKLVVKEEPLSPREQKKRDKLLKKHPELAEQFKPAEVKVEDPQAELRKLIREELAQFHIIPKNDQIVNVQPTPAPVYVINVPVPQPAAQPQPYPVYPPYPPFYPPYPGYPYPPYPQQPQVQPSGQPMVQPPVTPEAAPTPAPVEAPVAPQPAPVVNEPAPVVEEKPAEKVEEPQVPQLEKPIVDETVIRTETIAAKRREEKHKPVPQKIEKPAEVQPELKGAPMPEVAPEKVTALEPVEAAPNSEEKLEEVAPGEEKEVNAPLPQPTVQVEEVGKPIVYRPKPIIEEVTVYEEKETEPIVKVVEVIKVSEPAPKPVQRAIVEEAVVEEKVVVKEEKPVVTPPVEVKSEPIPEPVKEGVQEEPVKEEPKVEPTPVIEEKPLVEDIVKPIVEEKPPVEEDEEVIEEDEEEEEEIEAEMVEAKPLSPLDLLLAEEKAEEPLPVLDKKPTPKMINKPKQKVIRLPFDVKLLKLDKDVLVKYNELKNYILAFGVGSRVSNAGDTFRLHKKMYVRITAAGKGLKVYYALDPKKYQDSTIPVQDASNKGLYKEIPLVFKVKSDLSMKRAKMLVDDVMAANGSAQGPVENVDYIAELRNQ